MGMTTTIVFYLLFGAGVAMTLAISLEPERRGERFFRIASALVFWPLYVPVILRRDSSVAKQIDSSGIREISENPFAESISQVEAELDAAVQSLDGWAEGALISEQDRFAELRRAWKLQAERIRELDRLLARSEFAISKDDATPIGDTPLAADEPRRSSGYARQENIRKLHAVRQKLADDLTGTLAWVRELVTMIHLAKFTGAPASRADELVGQIAAAVEGLSEATRLRQELAEVG